MIVYRLEHRDGPCDGQPNHGPQAGRPWGIVKACNRASNVFGATASPPRDIKPHERVAITRDQIAVWVDPDAPDDAADQLADHGWLFARYELPDWAARRDGNQYVCDLDCAVLRSLVEPAELLPQLSRRPTGQQVLPFPDGWEYAA